MSARRALVAGAGIGGLASAIALARAGFDVALFERAPALETFGAGLQLTPNATRVLARLGALTPIEALALEPRAIRLRRGRDGAELSRLPLEGARKRWGAPYLVLHRADLQRALAQCAAREPTLALHLGVEAAGIQDDGAGVTVGVKRGLVRMSERGDLLVGADGLRSAMRERLGLGARGETAFSGRVAFRAQIEAGALPARFLVPEVSLWLGAGAHLVHYPLRAGAIVNVVAVVESGWRDRPGDHPWDGEGDRAALDGAFARWAPDARALIAAASQWRAWPLHERPAAPMATGRVALVGDAAHPMLPFLAQGAAQAIEDAGALGDCLAGAADIAPALAAYSRQRMARVSRVQREAREQARLYHMAGPLAFARDLAMRALGPERLLRRTDWIYRA